MKKVIAILTAAALCLCIGFSVAYYNTSSLGYDNANIIAYDGETVRVFDVYINYKLIKGKINRMRQYAPKDFIAVSCGKQQNKTANSIYGID